MAQLRVQAIAGVITIVFAVVSAFVTSGIRLGAIETQTNRNEADIRELRIEIRDELRKMRETLAETREVLERIETEQRMFHRSIPRGK